MPSGVHYLEDPFLEINGTDLSAYVRSLELPFSVDEIEKTASGDTTHINIPGLKNHSATAELNQDYDSSKVDDTLWSLASGRTTFTVKVRPSQAAVGSTNPEYSFTGFLNDYPPLGGSHGELHTTSISISANADDLARATT